MFSPVLDDISPHTNEYRVLTGKGHGKLLDMMRAPFKIQIDHQIGHHDQIVHHIQTNQRLRSERSNELPGCGQCVPRNALRL